MKDLNAINHHKMVERQSVFGGGFVRLQLAEYTNVVRLTGSGKAVPIPMTFQSTFSEHGGSRSGVLFR